MWLTFRTGPERGRTVVVDGETVVVGRDDACDIVVDDPNVSRQHAALEPLADGSVTLVDLGSSNGTFLNGNRVQSAVLNGNEQIQLGGTVLVSSRAEPAGRAGATAIGSLAGALQTPSAVHRLVVQRSLRRVTLLATAAIATAVCAALLFATGVLPPDDGDGSSVQRVVQRVAPSTVLIEARRDGRRVGGGSGWVLDGPRGLVVTNAHVVNGGTSLFVGSGRELPKSPYGARSPPLLRTRRVRSR